MEYGTEYLRRKLAEKSTRVKKRYKYYEMKNGVDFVGNMIPSGYRNLAQVLGWCGKAVDSLADRLTLFGFRNDSFGLQEIFRLNNSDILFDSAILSALVSSCSFLYISENAGKYPKIQVIDGENATGIIDTTTSLLKEGYAVLERDENGKPLIEAHFLPKITEYYVSGKHEKSLDFRHKSAFPLLVPIINRPDAKRPFGHSRISRACMNITQSALRTLLRAEVSAEFYSTPQKYILGLSEDAEFNNRLASLSSFLDFRRDEDGNVPAVGQFSQQSMSPHFEHLRSLASLFAGETGLTLDDLGFSSANPSSSEAIRAAHENLRLTARKCQRTFGTGFVNAGFLACCLRDDFEYERAVFADISAEWLPVFEPDAASLAGIADAVLKINQAVPDTVSAENLAIITGFADGGL